MDSNEKKSSKNSSNFKTIDLEKPEEVSLFKNFFKDSHKTIQYIDQKQQKGMGKESKLYVLLHGWGSNTKSLHGLADEILGKKDKIDESKDECSVTSTIIIPELPIKCFSTYDPTEIAEDIDLLIEHYFKDLKSKAQEIKIYLIGYSSGALLARRAYLNAFGRVERVKKVKNQKNKKEEKEEKKKRQYEYKLDPKEDTWTSKVDRIILMAGMNLGWSRIPYLSHFLKLFYDLEVILDTLLAPITQNLFIFKIRQYSDFITRLRYDWVAMSNYIEYLNNKNEDENNKTHEVLTIQLLGTQDNIVSPLDNIDFVTGKNFLYVDVSESDHSNVVKINRYSDDEKKQAQEDENLISPLAFRAALNIEYNFKENKINESHWGYTFKDHATYKIQSSHFPYNEFLRMDELEFDTFATYNKENREKVKDVVFIIHGIRDEGFWTKKIGRKIKRAVEEKGEKPEEWRTETNSYGYFGLLPFLFPYHRQSKTAWLMEQYITNLSLYPDANFHYIGHSNGTYLAANALKTYDFCKFKNIIFDGSVVNSNYDWEERKKEGKFQKILNFVATGDWAVAWFPSLFETLPFGFNRDLGSAGHRGFEFEGKEFDIDTKESKFNIEEPSKNQQENYYYLTDKNQIIHQLKYTVGGHGAGKQEEHWQTLAHFIVNGEVHENSLDKMELDISQNQEKKFPWLIIVSLLILFLILSVSGIILYDKSFYHWLTSLPWYQSIFLKDWQGIIKIVEFFSAFSISFLLLDAIEDHKKLKFFWCDLNLHLLSIIFLLGTGIAGILFIGGPKTILCLIFSSILFLDLDEWTLITVIKKIIKPITSFFSKEKKSSEKHLFAKERKKFILILSIFPLTVYGFILFLMIGVGVLVCLPNPIPIVILRIALIIGIISIVWYTKEYVKLLVGVFIIALIVRFLYGLNLLWNLPISLPESTTLIEQINNLNKDTILVLLKKYSIYFVMLWTGVDILWITTKMLRSEGSYQSKNGNNFSPSQWITPVLIILPIGGTFWLIWEKLPQELINNIASVSLVIWVVYEVIRVVYEVIWGRILLKILQSKPMSLCSERSGSERSVLSSLMIRILLSTLVIGLFSWLSLESFIVSLKTVFMMVYLFILWQIFTRF